MGGVAKGIKEGYHILRKTGLYQDYILLGNTHIFSKCTIPVHTDADRIPAPLDIAVVAIAAVMAGDVAFSGNPLANRQACDTGAQGSDFTHILMANGHGRTDVPTAQGSQL